MAIVDCFGLGFYDRGAVFKQNNGLNNKDDSEERQKDMDTHARNWLKKARDKFGDS